MTGSGTESAPRTLSPAGTTNQANSNIDESSAGARVRIAYANSPTRTMQELTLKYWSNINTTIYHRIYLTNFTFKARLVRCG